MSMTWGDANIAESEISLGLIKRDPAAAFGKRMCQSGQIKRIRRRPLARGVVHTGILTSQQGDHIHFDAAGSSGQLVQRSFGRFCGVVTGVFSRSDDTGGRREVVSMVGMFRLEENARGPLPDEGLDKWGNRLPLLDMADKACACKDKDCGEKVLERFKSFMRVNKDNKVSRARAAQNGKAAKRMVNCMVEVGIERRTIAKAMMDIQRG
jgi:hypothetical protein